MNTLPTKWCIKITSENKEILHKYWERIPGVDRTYDFYGWLVSKHEDDDSSLNYAESKVLNGYTELTLAQFKKWVLKDGSDLVGKRFYHHTNKKEVYTITKVEEGTVHIKGDFGTTTYPLSQARQFFEHGTWILFESERGKESLLEKAKRLYPVGTTFKCLHDCSGGPIVSLDEIRLDPFDTIRWYGIDGRCGCIYDEDKGGWAEIITEIKTTNMPIAQLTQQTISRSNLKAIHGRVCSKWQARIEEKLKENIFDEFISVPNDLLVEAFKEADRDQNEFLRKYFFQPVVSKEVNMKEWIEDLRVFRKSCRELIDVREYGMYAGKAFYLTSDFTWEIKKDEDGIQCLIPTKN